jgi:hypothetical protein
VPQLRPGDIVARRKGLVVHKGLVMIDGRILHNTPLRGEHTSTEQEFRAGRKLTVQSRAAHCSANGAPRAERRSYSLLRNNCEHTVHRLSTGRAHSPQLRAWVAGLSIAAVALVVIRHPAAAAAGFAVGRRFASGLANQRRA